jgi:hypothetical protein
MKNKNSDVWKAHTAGSGSEKQEYVILAMPVTPQSQLGNLGMAWAHLFGDKASVIKGCVLLSFAMVCYALA